MPELPEVEVVRRGLLPHTLGRTVHRVEVLDPRILRRQMGGADRLREAVEGQRLSALVRRGKFLWWRLEEPGGEDAGLALMSHLGMSGQWRVRAGADETAPQSKETLPAETLPQGTLPGDALPTAASEGPAPDPLRHRRVSLHLDSGTVIDLIDQREPDSNEWSLDHDPILRNLSRCNADVRHHPLDSEPT